MYYIKQEKVEELLDGRTISNLAKVLGISYRTLWGIFKKNDKCKKVVAMALINIKHGTLLNDSYMITQLNYYFKKGE